MIPIRVKAGADIHAISRITGGGFYENISPMMTEVLTANPNGRIGFVHPALLSRNF